MSPLLRVLHVFDPTLGWEGRLAVEQLLDRLPAERFGQHLVSLGPRNGESAHIEAHVDIIPHRFHMDFLAAPALGRLIERHDIAVVHAWGVRAVGVALSAGRARVPIITSVFAPASADAHSRRFRARRRGARVVAMCATETVRRCVVEQGVNPDDTVLVRPGLDFATLTQARESDLRERLGPGADAVVLLTEQPATRNGGQFTAFWGTAVRSLLEPQVRLIVPGSGREASRLRRLARAVERDDVLVLPGDCYRYEELIAVSDGLLLAGTGESSATAIAWAMGAGVPVVAAATRSASELLAHEHNAFLIKPDSSKRLAMRFADAIGRRHGWGRLTEVARGQAYEVFSLRRCIEQVQKVYDNLLEGRALSDGIQDPAIVQ